MDRPIEDYGIVGDGRSVALVARDGGIDWLCWPRFDSDAVFGGLLDPDGGTFSITPAERARVTRAYRPGTPILETRFELAGGAFRITDLMPVRGEHGDGSELVPEHELIRRVECLSGEVTVHVRFSPRPSFGRLRVPLRDAGPLGIRAEVGGRLFHLRAGRPLRVEGEDAVGRLHLAAGERVDYSFGFAAETPAALPPLGARIDEAILRTERWWRDWVARCRYEGPYRDAVVRSAIILKLLQYAPSGAVIAAPTTSLPEFRDEEANWDYRFCWLRDAAFTTRALFALGYADEAKAFVSWMLHATRLSRPRLGVLYDVFGGIPRGEREIRTLAGWRGMGPVRVGNGASGQEQLDTYGEVVDAVVRFAIESSSHDRVTLRELSRLGRYVCDHWQEKDSGIWEERESITHYTHSKVLSWVALQRLLDLHADVPLPHFDADRIRLERDRIRAEIEARGRNRRTGGYTRSFDDPDGEDDAALLLLPWYRYLPADDPRMRATWASIRERLTVGDGLLARYPRETDRKGAGYGMTVLGFWAAEYLALGGGSLEEAEAFYRAALRRGNDLGLFSEMIRAGAGEDPGSRPGNATGNFMGNFPQSYTHVGVVNAAMTIEERRRARQRGAGEELRDGPFSPADEGRAMHVEEERW